MQRRNEIEIKCKIDWKCLMKRSWLKTSKSLLFVFCEIFMIFCLVKKTNKQVIWKPALFLCQMISNIGCVRIESARLAVSYYHTYPYPYPYPWLIVLFVWKSVRWWCFILFSFSAKEKYCYSMQNCKIIIWSNHNIWNNLKQLEIIWNNLK